MKQNKDWTKEKLEKSYIGKLKATTISTNIVFEGKQRILDLSEIEKILRGARRITQNECYCRKKFRNCIDPMDGCLSLDEEADLDIEHGAREISVEQALEALKETYDAGLVHMAYVNSGNDKPTIICSCCSCCCHSLSAALRFGYSDHVFYSTMIACQDSELCIHCGECIDRCQFKARYLDDDRLQFEPEKCSGCGLCLKNCPNDAITMIRREESSSC